MRRAETDMVEMTLRSDGVVIVVETNPGVRHTPESMKNDVVVFRKLIDDQVLPVLWDVRAMDRPTPEAWKQFLEDIAEVLSALALVVDTDSRHVAGAFPWAINSFMFPSRVFESYEEALEWLLQFVPPEFSLDTSGQL
jgi:hypothetical protein